MESALLIIAVILGLIAVGLLAVLVFRPVPPPPPPDLSRLDTFQAGLGTMERQITAGLGQQLATQRTEMGTQLTHLLGTVTESLSKTSVALSDAQSAQRAELSKSVADLTARLTEDAGKSREESRTTAEAAGAQLRLQIVNLKGDVETRLTEFAGRIEGLTAKVEEKLAALQASNEARLEAMRVTVDEKLQTTLETRLGESFKLVSERLEAVQKGLGEMKSLADGVGDLKKVMTNVKTRGTWGEVQLQGLIEDILPSGSYVKNFAPREKSGERVEFAIRFPGGQDGKPIHLPIDSKFPIEDYQRLVAAQDLADLDGCLEHGKAMEDRIKGCAKDIRDKYLEPGVTTDIGILFLPFEGLYAEVLRRPGLQDALQAMKVIIAGPTTLAAMLNSFRMGFSTLAIQQRSGHITELLGAVKTEFGRFGEVINKVGDRLRQAQDEIEKVGTRTRAINKQLKGVEQVSETDVQRLLPVNTDPD
jgi:DNA recombination protein RmuC